MITITIIHFLASNWFHWASMPNTGKRTVHKKTW